MAEVPVYTLLAFNKDEEAGDQRRRVPLWQLEDAVRWAAHRGFDTILIELEPAAAARFETVPPAAAVAHETHGLSPGEPAESTTANLP